MRQSKADLRPDLSYRWSGGLNLREAVAFLEEQLAAPQPRVASLLDCAVLSLTLSDLDRQDRERDAEDRYRRWKAVLPTDLFVRAMSYAFLYHWTVDDAFELVSDAEVGRAGYSFDAFIAAPSLG